MTLQDRMIGKHPNQGIFYKWTDCRDTECTITKRHRGLTAKDEFCKEAVQSIAEWLVAYHLSEAKKSFLKQKILAKYNLKDYVQSLHVFPRTDKTKKGNFGEVVLSEYLSQTSGIKVLIYKLRYNPNVDQSMKGDDVLLVDKDKILLGESKFRSNPNKEAVEAACELMGNALTLPISLGFIADRLFEQGQSELAEQILNTQLKLSKTNFNIKNVGFILSKKTIFDIAENNMNSPNENFILISLGIDDPVSFMEMAFAKAKELILGTN